MSTRLSTMEVMEVESDEQVPPPKLFWGYKLLIGVSLVTIAAVAIWAGLQFGLTASNLSPTAESSSMPTRMPTALPSSATSVKPSSVPTRPPTTVPSPAPTVTPTGPSPVPTVIPSLAPTRLLTAMPSSAPTTIPTRPTSAPTTIPSPAPTGLPTAVLLPTSTLAPTFSNFLQLNTTQLVNFQTAFSWNITKISHGDNVSLHQIALDPATNVGNVLKVNYPAGSYKPSASIVGGIGVYATPFPVFSARSVRLTYEVFFPVDFDPIKGGKLPGLFLGPPGASGGNHVYNQASCRIMWRRNNPDGSFMAEAYVYVAQTQDASYYNIPGLVLDPIDGASLWRGLVNFNKGSWNKVDIFLTSNTATSGTADANGFLNLTINSISRSFDKLIYTTTASAIRGVTFTTFFGGSDNSWATLVPTSTYYKNLKLQKIS